MSSLLALATRRGGRLATLDGRTKALVPDDVEPEEVLLPILDVPESG